jgi:hypothetical protein
MFTHVLVAPFGWLILPFLWTRSLYALTRIQTKLNPFNGKHLNDIFNRLRTAEWRLRSRRKKRNDFGQLAQLSFAGFEARKLHLFGSVPDCTKASQPELMPNFQGARPCFISAFYGISGSGSNLQIKQ